MSRLSPHITGSFLGAGMRIGIVAARFNETIVDRLIEGATDTLVRHGVPEDDLVLVRVPGAFEVPGALQQLGLSSRFDGLIGLGAVIRGETPHFDYVCSTCASGCETVGRELRTPVGFGVLTCDSHQQAEARSGGKAGNKGSEVASAVIEMVHVYRQLQPMT